MQRSQPAAGMLLPVWNTLAAAPLVVFKQLRDRTRAERPEPEGIQTLFLAGTHRKFCPTSHLAVDSKFITSKPTRVQIIILTGQLLWSLLLRSLYYLHLFPFGKKSWERVFRLLARCRGVMNQIMKSVISRMFKRPETAENAVDLGKLSRLVRRYTVEQQQVPKDLLELVTHKYLESIPVAPKGQKLIIDRKRVEVRLE